MSLRGLPTQLRKLWKRWARGPPEVSRMVFDSTGADGKVTRLTVAKIADGSFNWVIDSKSEKPEVKMNVENFKAFSAFITGEEIK